MARALLTLTLALVALGWALHTPTSTAAQRQRRPRTKRPTLAPTTPPQQQQQPNKCTTGTWPTATTTTDYLVVGAGLGGGAALYDLARADPASSFTIVERNNRVGGNYWDVPVATPPNTPNPDLHIMGLGGMRVNQLTMPNQRRILHELNLTVYYTPWRNIMKARGRSKTCKAPRPDQTFADFCSYDDVFIAPNTGAFVGLADTPSGDPSFDAWCFLTNSKAYPCRQDDDSEPLHPLRLKSCNRRGVDGKPNTSKSADANLACPDVACAAYPDFLSFIQGYFSPEYAEFLAYDNVGFFGDYFEAHDACAYLAYVRREWNTASIVGYPLGGMSQVPKRGIQAAQAVAKSVNVFLGEPVLCARRSTTSNAVYEVRTTKRTILVSKFLVLNLPPPDLASVDGDIVSEILAQPESKLPKAVEVVTVAMQWTPGKPAWFHAPQANVGLDARTGNYSLRAYGDFGCFSRLEIVDVPMLRLANVMRPVYTDFRCKDLWAGLISAAEARMAGGMSQADAYAPVTARAMDELKRLFPQASIPAPVWTRGAVFPHGWFFGTPGVTRDGSNKRVTVDDVASWAPAPLGLDEPVCLVADAYEIAFSGWGESALRSARSCLTRRFRNTAVGTRIAQQFARRDAILEDDFDVMTSCDPPPLSTERCGPYGPYKADGTVA